MIGYQNLLFEVRGNVAHVTINRPDSANALNLDLARELSDAARRCSEDPEVRAVLLSGAGRMFCAGGDLKSFAGESPGELPGYLERVTHFLHKAISTFAHMNSPLVAAVQGSAAGAGFSLVCACDFVIAAESARFTMAYTRAGLTPDGSSTYFLPRIVGYAKALDLFVRNAVLSAREAADLGIVTRVVPDADLPAEAGKFAAELASGPTMAFGGIKRLLLGSANNTLDAQMARETEWIVDVCQSRDAREGIAAFIAKRPPKFVGE
jgi:2-(1,2-epoxy-1,2-dihydrophenyl)acetyl-CoA isomerase